MRKLTALLLVLSILPLASCNKTENEITDVNSDEKTVNTSVYTDVKTDTEAETDTDTIIQSEYPESDITESKQTEAEISETEMVETEIIESHAPATHAPDTRAPDTQNPAEDSETAAPTPPTDNNTAPIPGKAYKLHAKFASTSVYFMGDIWGNKLAVTSNKSKAINVFVEKSGDQYYIYCEKREGRLYIASEGEFSHCINTYIKRPPSAWIFDDESGTFISTDNGKFIGICLTEGYMEMRCYDKSNLDNTRYYSAAKFVL